MTLRTLNHGNYGIFLVKGTAGFISSTVVLQGVLLCFFEQGLGYFGGLHLGFRGSGGSSNQSF